MQDFFTAPTVRAGLAVLVLCFLIAAGFYLVSSFRDYADEDQQSPEDVLSNLRELHLKGDISDEEFRNIQSKTDLPPVGPDTIDGSSSPADSSENRQS